ncbi:inner membrane protein [Klebsiella pneumoniae]|uniref:Inner membrane protein n=1 Tax=Klebsiella pneumoniae TaxID=573 RepID=A0A2X3GSI2_KLEPN|nr:inner membrane protein [Klebsiella pneumoniae]
MNASLTLACLIAAGVGLVVQNTLMVAHHPRRRRRSLSLCCSIRWSVIVIFVDRCYCCARASPAFRSWPWSVKWVDADPPACWGPFSSSPASAVIKNVGAATTIAVLVASQLVGGLIMDLVRAHGVPVRALIGPLCGAVMLVVGAWLVARRQF